MTGIHNVICSSDAGVTGLIVSSVTPSTFSAGLTSLQFDNPAGTVAAGDLLLVVVANYSSATHTFPAGWTELTDAGGTAVAYKTAVGTEGGGVTSVTASTATGLSAICYQIKGWGGTPEQALATGTSTTPDPPSITPSWGTSNQTLYIAACTNLTTTVVSTYPSGYTENNTNSGFVIPSTCNVAAANKLAVTSSPENPGTFTLLSSGAWRAYTIAVRAA